ncbi:MAG: carboxylesterase/lipase family protein [Myxococcota bacterium]
MRHLPGFILAATLVACGAPPSGADAGTDLDASLPVDAGVDCNAGVDAGDVIAHTEQGPVRGLANADGSRSFLGIPFAKPPVGALRWRPPERDLACWSGVRDATQWGPACPQLEQSQGMPFDAGAPLIGQEDCLTLNVFTPTAPTPDAGLPVMVFIHGGGNTLGATSEEAGATGVRLYDASALAARGRVVVVSMEYRLGVLGFLTLAQLDAEGDAGVSGNYGLMDQQLALQWVQRNIAGFGGDPSRVLLFGESAGAVDTCMHLAAPGSRGLFHRAAIESGSCIALTAAEKRGEGATWLAATGCGAASDVTACLRAKTPEELIRAYPVPVNVGSRRPTVSWNPNVDGVVLAANPLDALRAGSAADVPVLVGHNREETNLTMPLITTEAEYRAALVGMVGATLADQVLQRYPVATYGSPRKALVQVTTDVFFGCQARMTSRAAALGHPTTPVYRYLFSHAPNAVRGAFHGSELPYVFQRVSALTATPTIADLAVEASMLSTWTRFAATGSPEGGGVTWPRLSSSETMLEFESTLATQSGWRTSECDFWDQLGGVSIPAPP